MQNLLSDKVPSLQKSVEELAEVLAEISGAWLKP